MRLPRPPLPYHMSEGCVTQLCKQNAHKSILCAVKPQNKCTHVQILLKYNQKLRAMGVNSEKLRALLFVGTAVAPLYSV